jgi:hypothetical protein
MHAARRRGIESRGYHGDMQVAPDPKVFMSPPGRPKALAAVRSMKVAP